MDEHEPDDECMQTCIKEGTTEECESVRVLYTTPTTQLTQQSELVGTPMTVSHRQRGQLQMYQLHSSWLIPISHFLKV